MKLFKSLLPLIVSIGVAVGAELVFRHFLGVYLKEINPQYWETFFTAFGVIYAVITGFVLFDVLDSYNDLLYTMRNELNAIQDLRDYVLYIREQSDVAAHIRRSLTRYVDSIIEREWQGMRENYDPLRADTSPELYEVMRGINAIQIQDENDELATGRLMSLISYVTTCRTKRWEFASDRMSPTLKVLICFLSAILVLGFVLLEVQFVSFDIFLVVSSTIAVHLAYRVITDLNRPFRGMWSIDIEPFTTLRDRFVRENELESKESEHEEHPQKAGHVEQTE